MAKDTTEGGIVETLKTVFWALVIAIGFRSVFFQPFWIPSESMKDTLLIGDFLFVNKMAYGYSRYSCEIPFTTISLCPFEERFLGGEPERGDVVVFRHPTAGTDYIKRLIGLPGDQIQMKDGVLYINGTAAPQVADGVFEEIYEPQGPMRNRPRCENGAVGEGGLCTKSRFIETLPEGRQHHVLNIDTGGPGDTTDVFTVPEGNYFVMGDNRDNSTDSRFSQSVGGVGMLPAKFLIGRADRVIFSSAGTSLFYVWTWRSDRFFKAIE
ncbi:signal peptidase I [Rhodobacter sp. SY28-1]|uniref:signal peptidase I n=1 Tax=Rhodobacter sp. SY28-1 TaxID=2562317 RepID=UPI0010C11975|nr:signal peptidase I [Rhodobacter sp. SY28-1]